MTKSEHDSIVDEGHPPLLTDRENRNQLVGELLSLEAVEVAVEQ